MAIKRQANFLSQQRVDVPHLRSIESAVAADFDTLAGRAMAGDRPLVVRGLTLANVAELVSAKTLAVVVADSLVINLTADEAGSVLWTESDRTSEVLDPETNAAVDGGWTPSTTNYVGMDFIRQADANTTDLVQFLASNTGLEVPKQVPLAKTLDYRIVISTLPFSAQTNLVPIARVTLNADSKVTAIKDARPMMFRLGSGGDNPDPASSFESWTRSEVLGSTTSDEFSGGDKTIRSQKDWQDAVMTRLWELGGGEFWYSSTADRNVRLMTYGDPGVSGEYFVWDSGTEELTWQNLRMLFDNSTVYSNDIEDGTMTSFRAGDCLYVDIDRTKFYAPAWAASTAYVKGDLVINDSGKTYVADVAGTSAGGGGPTGTGLIIVDGGVMWRYIGVGVAGGLVPQKTAMDSLGVGSPPGSRWVLAWRQGNQVFTRDWRYPLGTLFPPATTSTTGVVKLSRAAFTPTAPIVISDAGGTIEQANNTDVALILKAFAGGGGNFLDLTDSTNTILTSFTPDAELSFAAIGQRVMWPNVWVRQGATDEWNIRWDDLVNVGTLYYDYTDVEWILNSESAQQIFMGYTSRHGAGGAAIGTIQNNKMGFVTNSVERWQIEAGGDLSAVGANRLIHAVADPVDVQDASTKAYTDLMFRPHNAAMNGGMDLWQRGTSWAATAMTSYKYTADRWFGYRGASTMDVARTTTVPVGGPFRYAAKVGRPSGNTDATTIVFGQEIDREVVKKLRGRKVRITFYAQCGTNFSPTSRNLYVGLYQNTVATESETLYGTNYSGVGAGDILVGSSPVSLAINSYGFFDIVTTTTVNVAASAMCVTFSYTPTGTAGADDHFYITGVMIVDAGVSTPVSPVVAESFIYHGGDYAGEVRACQRYYEKSCALDTAPYSVEIETSWRTNNTQTLCNNGAIWRLGAQPRFTVEKRVAPTGSAGYREVVIWEDVTGFANYWILSGTAYVSSVGDVSVRGFSVKNNSGGGVTPGSGENASGHWAASAEL